MLLLSSEIKLLRIGMFLLTGAILIAGCKPKPPAPRSDGGASRAAASAERSGALLQSVAAQLADLPELSVVTLQPPVVVLDSTKSADGQDVLAVLTRSPGSTDPLFNYLQVPAGNGRFRSIGVRSGDIVKYFAKVESELQEEFGDPAQALTAEQRAELLKLPEAERERVLQTMVRDMTAQDDILTASAIELKVAQAPNDNAIIIEDAYPAGVDVPTRLEVWRYLDDRLGDLVLDLNRYAQRGVPRLGWEPSPDQQSLEQIVERLNQWLRQTDAEIDWRPAELIGTLPPELRDAEKLQMFISPEALDRNAFSQPTEELRATQALAYEGRLLQEATWARDISRWVGRNEFETLPRVEKLFDWTVRNLQLDSGDASHPAYRPWQSLIAGHATAEGRAWVFAQLCRQQNVPVVIVRSQESADWWWCGALVAGKLYLFDPALGLAVPGPSDSAATLAEVRADPALLREFDLPEDPYPADEESLKSLQALVIAGPQALTRRAKLLEERLTGDDVLMLFVAADAIAKTLTAAGMVDEVALWEHPFATLLAQVEQPRSLRTLAAIEFEPFVHRPRLWKARLLHFRGRQGKIVDTARGNIETILNDHRDAGRLYTHKNIRPTEDLIAAQQSADARRAWTAAKRNATYWLGLLTYDRGRPAVAIDPWFKASEETDKWRQGAEYNHARALEELEELEQAAELLNAEDQPRGSRVRAARLAR